MLTGRKKRELDRRSGKLRDARLIIIATEGSDTEELYFKCFGNLRVQVKVIPSENGYSAPNHILQNMEAYKSEYQLGAGDELWLAVDLDRWKDRKLSEVAAVCVQNKIRFAVSNPCFELWLALHLDEPLPEVVNAGNLEVHLRRSLGHFNKSNYPTDFLMKKVTRAVDLARSMDTDKTHRWPNKIGTRVYRIIESIMK